MPNGAWSLSPLSRALTSLLAAAYAVVGLLLFLAPGWAAPRFASKVSNSWR